MKRHPSTWLKPSGADPGRSGRRRKWDVLPNKFGGHSTVWGRQRTDEQPDDATTKPDQPGGGMRRRRLPDQPNPGARKQPVAPKRRRTPPVAQDQALRDQPGWRPWHQPADDAVLGAAFFGDDGLGPNPPSPQKKAVTTPVPPDEPYPFDDNGFELVPPTGGSTRTAGGSTETPGREPMGDIAAFYAGQIDNSTAQTRAATKAQQAENASAVSQWKLAMAEKADAEALWFSGMEGYEESAAAARVQAQELREDAATHAGLAQKFAEEALAEARRFAPSS